MARMCWQISSEEYLVSSSDCDEEQALCFVCTTGMRGAAGKCGCVPVGGSGEAGGDDRQAAVDESAGRGGDDLRSGAELCFGLPGAANRSVRGPDAGAEGGLLEDRVCCKKSGQPLAGLA